MRVYRVADGKQLFAAEMPVSGYEAWIEFHPTGDYLLVTEAYSADPTVYRLDVPTGRKTRLFDVGALQDPSATALSHDGSRLATVNYDRVIKIRETTDWKVVAECHDGIETAAPLAFCPGHSDRLASGGERCVRVWDTDSGGVWDTNSGKEVARLTGHIEDVAAAQFTPDGMHIISIDEAGVFRIGRSDRGEASTRWDDVFPPLGSDSIVGAGDAAALHPTKGHLVARVSTLKPLELFDLDAGRTVKTIGESEMREHLSAVVKAAGLVPPESLQALYEMVRTTPELKKKLGSSGGLAVVFAPDGLSVAASLGDGQVRVWELDAGEQLLTFPIKSTITSMAYAPDGSRIVTGGEDGSLAMYDVRDGKQLSQWQGHDSPVQTVLANPGGRRFASQDWDGDIKTWELASGRQHLSLPWFGDRERPMDSIRGPSASPLRNGLLGYLESTANMCFSPDGKVIASPDYGAKGSEACFLIRDAETGRVLRRLGIPDGSPDAICFSPHGNRIATSKRVGGVQIWDADTGTELLSFDPVLLGDSARAFLGGLTGEYAVIHFGADGRRLIDVSSWGDISTWYGGPRLDSP